jgi:hypothetical protein
MRRALPLPGESVRKEQGNLRFAYGFVLGAAFASMLHLLIEIWVPAFPSFGRYAPLAIFVGLGVAAFWIYGVKRKFEKRMAALDLGEQGEAIVWRELDRLRVQGYEIFHGLPCPRGDVDHVAVGPAGVFVIETKARTNKRRGKVTVRNGRLWIGDSDGTDALEQARQNARHIRTIIRERTGYDVGVEAAVVVPSWKVDDDDSSDVKVRNQTGIVTRISGKPAKLSTTAVSNIAAALTLFAQARDEYRAGFVDRPSR